MSKAQAESVIKNIIREIAQECASKGQSVSETLVAFMVKAVVLDPKNAFDADRTLTKEDVQKLIKICVERLLGYDSPSLDTVKMQIYFDMNYLSRDDFLDEHRRVLESRLQPVVREIVDSRSRTREEFEALYRKVVSYILLRSGLGSPTDLTVIRETTAALQSVFPQAELGTFLTLSRRDKERQLRELTEIVTGIRLFNKECGKGGEAIDDLPGILNEAIPSTTKVIDDLLDQGLQRAYCYAGLIEKFVAELPADSNAPPPEYLKESLFNIRQFEHFLRILLNDIILSAQHVEALENELATRLKQLKVTVQSKIAVPTAQVYPQFVHLASIWGGFQDEMVLLSVLSSILNSLDPFTAGHRDRLTQERLDPFLAGALLITDEERRSAKGPEERIDPKQLQDFEWIFPETTKDFDELTLQYRGYCAWSLVAKDRFLVPGNPHIGILRFRNALYAFSSKDAVYEFLKNPELFIAEMTEAAKKSPELIQLLDLHQQFLTIAPYSRDPKGRLIEKPITRSEAGTQTDTHFHDTNIVRTYEWNEWELRRKALKLANLRRKVTHSVQTNLSHHRRDNATQVYQQKDKSTVTKTDGYTNVPNPQVFYAGLRGAGMDEHGEGKPSALSKVDLTIDVDQS